jgi:ribonuclease D
LGDELVDPLAGINLAPLLDAFLGHELLMHGADYDLRLLRKHHKFTPTAIFDTMLAARLLGIRQFSLGHLVEKYVNVKLEKGSQKANWAMRPLTEKMIRYARDDTRFLKPLADTLKGELEIKGRLSWHKECCAKLIADCALDRPPDMDSIWRIKGSNVLSRPGLAVLRELWGWREEEAIHSNRPPFFVLSHDSLVSLAAAAATQRSIDTLIPRQLSERRRNGVMKAVARGLGISPDDHPRFLTKTSRRASDAEKKRFSELQTRRDRRAEELKLDPTVIASRGTLSDLAYDWERNAPNLMDWQKTLLAE